MSLIAYVEALRKARWEKGKKEYRDHPDAPFNGDGKLAIDHEIEELADGMNYNDQSARDREISARAASEIDAKYREIVLILDDEIKRRAAEVSA